MAVNIVSDSSEPCGLVPTNDISDGKAPNVVYDDKVTETCQFCCCCTSGEKCCALATDSSYPFTPADNWSVEEASVANANAKSCVGQAVLTVSLLKDPPCPPSCVDCEAFTVYDPDYGSYTLESFCDGGYTGFTDILEFWLEDIYSQLQAAYGTRAHYYTLDTNIDPADVANYDNCYLTIWNLCPFDSLSDWYIGGFCGPMFGYDFEEPLIVAAYDWETIIAETDAAFAIVDNYNTPYIFRCGSKVYCFTPNFTMNVQYPSIRFEWSEDFEQWIVYSVGYDMMIDIAITCTDADDSACTEDYDWPLELSCACSSQYLPATPIAVPTVCKLYLDTAATVVYDSDLNKCRATATYKGAVASGTVNCTSTPNDPDCVCCNG